MKLHRTVLKVTFVAVGTVSGAAMPASQYAGEEVREIKALSESEITNLLAGKGMGFAKAAELNGYPGPMHVLELASQLRLSEEQVNQARAIHARMEAEAKSAGAALVEAERELDALFRRRGATPESLAQSLRELAIFEAKVREAHLRAHIEQTRLLSEEQVAQYSRLRGYSGGEERHGHHHDQHNGH